MTNAHNARLLLDNGPLVHYARRPLDELKPDDSGGTTCGIHYYLGSAPARPHNLAKAVVIDEPVTCVICAIDHTVFP